MGKASHMMEIKKSYIKKCLEVENFVAHIRIKVSRKLTIYVVSIEPYEYPVYIRSLAAMFF